MPISALRSSTAADAKGAIGDRCGRPNWMELDPSAIADNVRALRRYVGPGVKVVAALKANGYGFGILRAATAAAAGGADALSLVDAGEAVRIREHGVALPILLYGGSLVTRDLVDAALGHRIMLTVHSRESAQAYARLADKDLTVYVEVNAGGERFGLAPDDVVPVVRWLGDQPRIKIGGVYTHPGVTAGEGAVEAVDWQFGRFVKALDDLARAGIDVPVRMAASSKMLAMGRHMSLTAVDVGSLVYGLDPGGPGTTDVGVRPAFVALKSRLVHVLAVDRPDFRAHAPFPVRDGMRVGVIPFGASDRLAELHCGEVLVRGRRATLFGKLSAEHARIDLTDVPDAAVGDEVVIIGAQGGTTIGLDAVMRRCGTAACTVTEAIPPAMLRLDVEAERAASSSSPARRAR